ncbi:unnamed protein product [Cuscuta epithymum]|uniref:F-box/LRR-repeat protein 15/At3g58940/PEG3-like LRR domain-containing protein n=1 Tax=Cuscuta epithymum TaxID=186058 RepID=A0AAV0D0N2_9ASTE|nr:unnamed protein product [Cuscuta epithymum]
MEERDRISELPADILDKIMGKLWIEEAATMAVLNTVWRDAWYSLTEVAFDASFHYILYCDFIKNPDKWHDIVNDYFKKHNGNIKRFDMYFGQQVYRGDFDKLFLSVTKKGVQELDLQIYSDDDRNYRLPPCILKCSTLKTFYACGVKIDQITPRCMFPNVTFLSFDLVHFGASSLQHHAVDLPKLQRLTFSRCTDISHFNITAPKLGILSIEKCYISGDDDVEEEEEDDYYSDDDERDSDDSCSSGGDDNNDMFCYNPTNEKDKPVGGFLPANLDLGSVSRLHLCCNAIWGVVDDFGRKGLQMPMLDVKYLNLSGDYYPGSDSNSKLVNLLRSCPKLCELEICFQLRGLDSPTCGESVSNLLEGLHRLHHRHNDLQTLKLSVYSASKSEVHLITGLIGCFPTCKKVFIFSQTRFSYAEEVEARNEILSSSRALSTAEVYFK